MKKILYVCLIGFLTACHLGEWHYVDFANIEAGGFQVTKQQTTDLQKLANDPNQLAVWGLTSDIMRSDTCSGMSPAKRASSVSMNSEKQE